MRQFNKQMESMFRVVRDKPTNLDGVYGPCPILFHSDILRPMKDEIEYNEKYS